MSMLQNLRQRFFPAPSHSDSLREWRGQLLQSLLNIALAVGVLAAVPSIVLAVRESLWPVVVADLIAILWIAKLWHGKSMAYRLRTYQLLSLMYLLAMVLLVYIGQASQIYLIAIPVLAVLLLNMRVAAWILAINTLSFSLVGYFSHADHTLVALNGNPFLAWVIMAVNFFAICVLLTISCGFLLHSFEGALQRHHEHARHLHTMLYTDSMTGLPTANAQHERINAWIDAGTAFSLLVLNLDDFRLVNNNLGAAGGNAILAQVTTIMRSAVGDQGELARASGAEFTLLVAHTHEQAQLQALAKRVQAHLERPLSFQGAIVHVALSVGIARFPIDADSTDEMLRKAQVALQDAIAQGGRGICSYASWMDASQQEQIWLDHHLRDALETNQFALHYQPKILLETGRATSVEGLLRWKHPQRGNIPPDQFIPRAEATGLIIPIGRWVLETAARQAANWAAWGRAVRVAINVSARQLADPELIQRLREAQTLAGGLLDIELTESCLIANEKESLEFVEQCRVMGFGVHLDDFGTGYSSLARLGGMPLTVIKLDRAFIAPIGKSQKSDALLKAMMSIGKELRLQVVAEGVETQEQVDYLQSLGVRYVQGWLFARAMSSQDCDDWLAVNLEGRTPEEAAASTFVGLL